MPTELHIIKVAPDGEDESYTLEDQDGNWLQDSESLEELILTAKQFGAAHGIDTVAVHLDTF